MAPNEDVRDVSLTDLKRTTQRFLTGSEAGSVLERQDGSHVANDTQYIYDAYSFFFL